MDIDSISVTSHANMSASVSVNVESWNGHQAKHHIRQQGVQIAQNNIDAPHDVKSVQASPSGWSVDAIILLDEDDGDQLAGELFQADSWKYRDGGQAEVTYHQDAENDQQGEIRERVESEVAPTVAERTPFSEDMLDITNVRIRDQYTDNISFDL